MSFAFQYVRHRTAELLVWMGIPLLGALAAGEPLSPGRFAVFVVALTAAMAHVLLVNDWGGLRRDPLEVTRYPGATEGSALAMLRGGAVLALLVSLLCGLYLLPLRALLAVGCLGISLSVLYSHPAVHLKENPVASKVLHAMGGTLQFLGGYLVFSGQPVRGACLGLFFGWVLTAGHFFHECKDAAVDDTRDIDTWATRWGSRHCARVGLSMFGFAHVYLLILAELGVLSATEAWLLSAPVAVHAFFAARILREDGRLAATLRRYHLGYRAVYASSGAAFALVNLASWAPA